MRTGREGQTIGRIRAAVEARNLPREFTPSQVNRALGISWAGSMRCFAQSKKRDTILLQASASNHHHDAGLPGLWGDCEPAAVPGLSELSGRQ